MSTVHEVASLLPGPAELRAHLNALAVLDATIGDDPRFCVYTFDATRGPGEETALMVNGSGDDFSVHFTPAGVLIRGFDHESEMSPYGTDDEQVWPGVIDEVPAALRPILDLALAIVLPSWHDALAGIRPPALNADYLADHPDHPAVRDRLIAALRLPSATEQEVLTRLLTTAARTVPDGFLPHDPNEKDSAFEPMLEPSVE
ncbi:hypothetical protein ABZ137_05665 [Streptomyces bobili]|uniref:hypothetical protein n=1 Tax=Streptomyces bobili TaxID=67280 RepID=UPI0033B00129